ncbi:hypothetical protein EF847_04555 [Actinobacteria bacterium YIM 96077]|nr:hypothetical protein EF847_04555 [Actinobacteria bacterium YIM 96077]
MLWMVGGTALLAFGAGLLMLGRRMFQTTA